MTGLGDFIAAEAARAVTEQDLEDVLTRAGRRACARRLALVLSETSGMTLSEAERILRRLLRDAGLQQPITNYPIGPYRADFCWPDARLIVEADGAGAHGTRRGHAHDTRRDVRLTNAGWTVLRFAYDAIVHDPRYVEDAIRTALATM